MRQMPHQSMVLKNALQALVSFQRPQIAFVLWTRAILMLFEKLTRACFIQIALETILLPMLITKTSKGATLYISYQNQDAFFPMAIILCCSVVQGRPEPRGQRGQLLPLPKGNRLTLPFFTRTALRNLCVINMKWNL